MKKHSALKLQRIFQPNFFWTLHFFFYCLFSFQQQFLSLSLSHRQISDLLEPQRTATVGRAAARAYYRKTLSRGVKSISLFSVYSFVSSGLLFSLGWTFLFLLLLILVMVPPASPCPFTFTFAFASIFIIFLRKNRKFLLALVNSPPRGRQKGKALMICFLNYWGENEKIIKVKLRLDPLGLKVRMCLYL